jgi:hypothetical protein
MEHKVGQILYICDEERMKIIPIQVVEEVIRNTIEGSEKNYVIMFPDTKKTLANLNKIKGKIFQDPKKVQDYMIENASDAIKRMKKAAENLRDQCFSTDLTKEFVGENSNNQNNTGVQVETNDDIIMVDLGGGVKAKMNSSSLTKVVNQ